ncbi:MAG: hypothetical protein ACRD9R_11450 [Pyrinomonadaceae bacterium]
MRVEVSEESITTLEEYAAIPIAFEVFTIFDVANPSNGLGEFVLTERSLNVSYVKDYDAIDGEGPTRWARRFDISNLGVICGADGRPTCRWGGCRFQDSGP